MLLVPKLTVRLIDPSNTGHPVKGENNCFLPDIVSIRERFPHNNFVEQASAPGQFMKVINADFSDPEALLLLQDNQIFRR